MVESRSGRCLGLRTTDYTEENTPATHTDLQHDFIMLNHKKPLQDLLKAIRIRTELGMDIIDMQQ